MVAFIRLSETGHPLNAAQVDRHFNASADAALRDHGFRRMEAMALAARMCAEAHPDAFGYIHDGREHEEGKRQRVERLNGLYRRIGEAVELRDLAEDLTDLAAAQMKHGLGKMRFRMAPEVHYHPAESALRRLVEHVYRQTQAGRRNTVARVHRQRRVSVGQVLRDWSTAGPVKRKTARLIARVKRRSVSLPG